MKYCIQYGWHRTSNHPSMKEPMCHLSMFCCTFPCVSCPLCKSTNNVSFIQPVTPMKFYLKKLLLTPRCNWSGKGKYITNYSWNRVEIWQYSTVKNLLRRHSEQVKQRCDIILPVINVTTAESWRHFMFCGAGICLERYEVARWIASLLDEISTRPSRT